ncbi:Prolyl endopeptidase-like [Seminavis robusta]|uniref:Prolyl endopeptidase n=1 Tax=Seminavis robusta TaxID=568900 RepID=A0A9N8D7H2_9STRA|nr:Prolyl endopeptidase-like [Seminavis robusta]|eukprot:Sro26_g017660.1 Prolyl endopeptidase-like (777) ;mRNA; f:83488-85818
MKGTRLLSKVARRIKCRATKSTGPGGWMSIQVQHRRHWLSSASSRDFDPYDRYRSKTMTEDIWEEIQKENEHTRRSIDKGLYNRVLEEILHAMQHLQNAASADEPGPTGKFLYSFHDNPQLGQRIYKRRPVSSSSVEPSSNHTTVMEFSPDRSLVAMSLSADESLVACLVEDETQSDTTFSRPKRVIVRHIDSGTELDVDVSTKPKSTTAEAHLDISSLEMGPLQPNDTQYSLFLVTNDNLGRPHAVWACGIEVHDKEQAGLLSQCSQLKLLHCSSDPAEMVNVQRTKGCHYMAIQATTKTCNEVYLCQDLASTPRLVCERSNGIMYHLDVGANDDIYILVSSVGNTTNSELGLEYSLWKTTVDDLPLQLGHGQCGTLVAGGSDSEYAITDMDIFANFTALYERSTTNGKQRISILPKAADSSEPSLGPSDNIIVPIASCHDGDDCIQVSPGGNMHFEANHVRFSSESPSSPPSVYEFDILTKELRLVSGDANAPANRVQQKRVHVTSKDGTKVPLSLIYREKNATTSTQQETRPTVLIGYGSYGEPLDLSYNPALVPLLKRGFVLAYAHVRGGGCLGRDWYMKGRLYNKHKAIEDYIACAQALSSPPLSMTEARKLSALGFSAAGVTIGAAVNQTPDVFGTVVLISCFLDVKKTMENDQLFLTEHEYDEFGNPTADPEAAEAISSYCPVSNALNGKEEHTARFLIAGTFDDHQVPFYNSLIYGKKLRAKSRVKSRVHIHIEHHGGHYLQPQIAALQAAFLLGNKASYYGILVEEE